MGILQVVEESVNCLMQIMLLKSLLVLTFVTFTAKAQVYPPGVPPPNSNEGIKFHDPSEFKQEQQQLHQNQSPTNQHMGHRSRGHHHAAKLNIQNQDMQKTREHMKSHNKEKHVNIDDLSQPQLIMQHFRNYDLDKNGKIDGLELLKAALIMNDEHDYEDGEEEEATVGGSEGRHEDIQEMASEADETLQEYDENNDGFIHYGEFYRNHKKMLDAQNQ